MATRTGTAIQVIDVAVPPHRRADRPDGRDEPGTDVQDRTDIVIRLGRPPDVADAPATIRSGASVEVLCRFDGRWTAGFTVVDVSDAGYRLRRRSDGSVLPAWFPHDQVRPAPPTP